MAPQILPNPKTGRGGGDEGRGAPAPRPSFVWCSVQVVAQPTGGVARPQLAEGLLLDLADPLPGQTQPRPDLGQRVLPAVDQAVAEADDLALTLRQRPQDDVQLVLHRTV